MNLALSAEESEAVQKALRTYLADLRMEISNTDNAAYRRELQAERTALEGVVGRLDDAAAAEGSGDSVISISLVWLPVGS